MPARRFLDTNVLVYAFDAQAPAKKRRALAILQEAGENGQALISTQVLQEFYHTVTRKIERPVSEEVGERALHHLAHLPIVQVDTPMVLAAARTSRAERLSFWDALILTAALEAGCTELLSEDFQPDRQYGSLVIRNPFAEGS